MIWHDPDAITLAVLLRGLRARSRKCPLCGSAAVHPSTTQTPLLGRVLQLRVYRCEECYRRFLLPRRGVRVLELLLAVVGS